MFLAGLPEAKTALDFAGLQNRGAASVPAQVESAPSAQAETSPVDRFLDSLSDEELTLLVMDLEDEDLLLALGAEFFGVDLELLEFTEGIGGLPATQ